MAKAHESHVLRFSPGASTYDYICVNCKVTDEVPGGWGELANPCTKPVGQGGLTYAEWAADQAKREAEFAKRRS